MFKTFRQSLLFFISILSIQLLPRTIIFGSANTLQVTTLNSELYEGEMRNFNANQIWGRAQTLTTVTAQNPHLCLSTDYVSVVTIFLKDYAGYISQNILNEACPNADLKLVVMWSQANTEFSNQFLGEAPIYQYTDSQGNVFDGFKYRDILENKGGIYANYKKTEYLCLVEFSTSQCKLTFDYWSVDWKRNLSHSINGRNPTDIDYQSTLFVKTQTPNFIQQQTIQSRLNNNAAYYVPKKMTSAQTPLFFVDMTKTQRLQLIQFRMEMSANEVLKVALTHFDPSAAQYWENHIDQSDQITTVLSDSQDDTFWFQATLPESMVTAAQGNPTKYRYIIMAVDWKVGTESITHMDVKMEAIQIFADEPDNWEISTTAQANPNWNAALAVNKINLFESSVLTFKYRWSDQEAMNIPLEFFRVEAYPMSNQWGIKYFQQHDLLNNNVLPTPITWMKVTRDNFLSIKYTGNDIDTMTQVSQFKFMILQKFDNLGQWPIKQGSGFFQVHVLPLCTNLKEVTDNTAAKDVIITGSKVVTGGSNSIGKDFQAVVDNWLCKYEIAIESIVRKRVNSADLVNQRIDQAIDVKQAVFTATDQKYGLITYQLSDQPFLVFKDGTTSATFAGQYTINLALYDDLSLSLPTKLLDKVINLKVTRPCVDDFNQLSFPNQEITVQHGTDGKTVATTKKIESELLAYIFTHETCGQVAFANNVFYENEVTLEMLPIEEPDSLTEKLQYQISVSSYTPDSVDAESINVDFTPGHSSPVLNLLVMGKNFRVTLNFKLPCLADQADKMDLTDFDLLKLKVTYDFMNPEDILVTLPAFTANIEHCGKISGKIEGPSSVDALLKSNNIMLIPRTDTGAAEGFQISLKRTSTVSMLSSSTTTDTLNVEFEIKFKRGTLLMQKIDFNVNFVNIESAKEQIALAAGPNLPPLLGPSDFALLKDCKELKRPENLDNCYKYKFEQAATTVTCDDKYGLERQICEFQLNSSTTIGGGEVSDQAKKAELENEEDQAKSNEEQPQDANNQQMEEEEEDEKSSDEKQEEQLTVEDKMKLENQIQKVCGAITDPKKFEKCKETVILALNNQMKKQEEILEGKTTEKSESNQAQETISLQEDKIVISNFQGFEGITVEPFQEEEYQSEKRWESQGLQPIIPKKTTFTNDGNAGIKLTRKVTMVPRTDIVSKKRQEKLAIQNKRQLQDITASIDNEQVNWNDITQVYFDCETGCKEFDDFEVTYFDGQSLFIQFNFFEEGKASEVAKQINENESVDENIEMIVKIDGRFLYDSTQKSFLDIIVEFLIQVPKQLDPLESLTYTEKVETAESAMTTVATGNMFVSIFLGASLKYLWNIINLIQFIVFFTDWNLSLPPKTEILIVQLRKLALLEFVKDFPIYKTVLEEAESTAQNLTQLQLNDPRVEEMVIIGFIAAIIILILLIVFLLVKFCKKKPELLQKIKNKVFWNTVLRSLLQSYFKVAMGVAVGIQLITWDSQVQFGLAIGQIGLAVILGATPLYIFFLLKKNQSEAESMAGRIGSLYLGIRTRPIESFMYSVVFLVRRFSFALLTYLLIDFKGILILAFIVLNTLKGIYLCWARPNDGLQGRSVELINEFILQMVAFNTLLFLVLKIEKVEAAEIETIFLYLIGVMIGGNILLIAYMSLKKVYLLIKKKIREKNFKKQMQKKGNEKDWAGGIQTPSKSRSSEGSPHSSFSLRNQQSINNSRSNNGDSSLASCKNEEDSGKKERKNSFGAGKGEGGVDDEAIPRLLANISELRGEDQAIDAANDDETHRDYQNKKTASKTLASAKTLDYQPLENDATDIDLTSKKRSQPKMKRNVESSKQLARQLTTTQQPAGSSSTQNVRESVQERWILDMIAREENEEK